MSSDAQQTTCRLLVIDDNESIHEDFRKILTPASAKAALEEAKRAILGTKGSADLSTAAPSLHYALDFAAQGRQGLDLVHQALSEGRAFSMAFVDMRMPPGWDGLETTARILAEDEAIQIVICTAYSDYSLEEIRQRLGPTDRVLILKKPFEPMEAMQLAHSLSQKWLLLHQAKIKMEELDRRVQERTAETQYVSLHDRLTGLPNRVLLTERIRVAIERGRRNPAAGFAVLFVDLDRFKLLNDSLGHEVGDLYLVETARRLKETLRKVDEVCRGTPVRLGGDEFIVFLDDLRDSQQAVLIAERVRQALSAPFELNGRRLENGASIGIATGDRGYENPADVIRDADIAMYQAKAAGRGRCVRFDQAMHDRIVSRTAMEADLREAIAQGQFVLHYQPIVHVERGIESLEALVRWQHPRRGLLGPGEFVPLAEEIGLIAGIDRIVLLEASRQLARWRGRFAWCKELSISVNVSRCHINDPELVDQVLDALAQAQIPPQNVALEITESAVLEDKAAAMAVLARLHGAHIQLHLDDFGTGQSSLSCLHELPLSALKIDRAFIENIEQRSELTAILRSIVGIAKALKIQVIAEGIERPAQIEILRQVGCHILQGHFISRPLDVNALEPILQAGPQVFAAQMGQLQGVSNPRLPTTG